LHSELFAERREIGKILVAVRDIEEVERIYRSAIGVSS
jgi:hypothetical protein